jgi:hypothetical protein
MNKKHLGVYLRGKVYWIKYSRNGRPFNESSHSEKESDAVRLLNLRLGDIYYNSRPPALHDHVKAVAWFAYITGWRANREILPLQWRQVDFAAGNGAVGPGDDKEQRGQMTGHKTRSVFEGYNIVSRGDLFDAARRLDLFTGTVAHEHVQAAKAKTT